jgi:hypothetical protein
VDLRLSDEQSVQKFVLCPIDTVKRSWWRNEPRAAAARADKSPGAFRDSEFVRSDLRAETKCALSLDLELIPIGGGKGPFFSYWSASAFAKLLLRRKQLRNCRSFYPMGEPSGNVVT